MTDDRKLAVQNQFGRQASWYSVSRVHRESPGLEAMLRLAAPAPHARVLDIATGTGFAALSMAPRCAAVIGLDLTLGMVREARRLAEERGVSNLVFCLGDAEALPFAARSFDIVTCRLAAHHFPHLERAFAEMTRVVASAGRVVIEDTCAPEAPDLAALMNDWELRRDPSHVADRPPSGLRAMMEQCGLRVKTVSLALIPQLFDDWVRRSGVSAAETAALRASFLGASPEARAAFQVRLENDDLHFAWPEIVILGIRP